jgi:hypothetical protein
MSDCGSSSNHLATSISTSNPLPMEYSLRLALSGAIAQLGERLLCKQEVAGSIPAGSISEMPANRHVLALAAAAEYP